MMALRMSDQDVAEVRTFRNQMQDLYSSVMFMKILRILLLKN
jgi:hypothetical protein